MEGLIILTRLNELISAAWAGLGGSRSCSGFVLEFPRQLLLPAPL